MLILPNLGLRSEKYFQSCLPIFAHIFCIISWFSPNYAHIISSFMSKLCSLFNMLIVTKLCSHLKLIYFQMVLIFLYYQLIFTKLFSHHKIIDFQIVLTFYLTISWFCQIRLTVFLKVSWYCQIVLTFFISWSLPNYAHIS